MGVSTYPIQKKNELYLLDFLCLCVFLLPVIELKSKEAMKHNIWLGLHLMRNHPKALYNYPRHFLDCV